MRTMAKLVLKNIDELNQYVGRALGVSDWHLVTQEEINMFADATGDHQWIHVDVERAKQESPYGGPIAHGYYTI
ncbi:MAG: MaoC/PaaZ C-terminal domain-containing protein, partial [Candidatus Helarchaeota archaeon]